jgi:uncharacterized membrane protein (DUF4010 family)
MLAGLAGGFVSGTATTGAMAARSRAGAAPRSAAMAGALLASVATLIQLVVVTSIAAPGVARRLVVPAVLGALVLVGEAWWLLRKPAPRASEDVEHSPRPLGLGPAIVLAAVITSVLLLAAWMDDQFGGAGAVVATATGALADLHAAAVAVATLAKDGVVSGSVAEQAIGLGLLTNTLGKLVAAWVGGGPAFARDLFVAFLPAAVVVAATLAF